MAFQMIDDLLDYTQTTATLNKPVLEDLHNGIVTLPLIYAYQNVPEQLAHWSGPQQNRCQQRPNCGNCQ
jgi:heptaprenyl diphosphate synthase